MRPFVIRSAEILTRLGAVLREHLRDGEIMQVEVKPWEPTRSLEQNAKLWACLSDIADQVEWYGQKYPAEDWKDILTAGLKREQRLVPGIQGGLVALGSRTSKMTVREMIELIEFVQWFGTDKGVRWTDPTTKQAERMAA